MTAAPEEQYLTVAHGRTLAYMTNGNPSSKKVVVYYHGAMTVGDATQLPNSLLTRGAHYITPTLPGWGLTSPRPSGAPFNRVVASDTTALLKHLHPDAENDDTFELYITGGSFGTVPAQMMLGASYELFPLGQKIKGCLLMAGLTSYKHKPSLYKHLSFSNYIGAGPWAVRIPFKLLPRLMAVAITMQVNTPEKAENFMQKFFFDKMNEQEKASLVESKKQSLEAINKNMSKGVHKSVSKSWDGIIDMPYALHSDWEFREGVLSLEDTPKKSERTGDGPKVLVVACEGDQMSPMEPSKWMASHYKNGELMVLPGGHLSAMGHLEDIWEKLFASIELAE